MANGTCTTRLIESAGIPGTLSIWADPLHDGPVPGGLTDAELLDLRERHHAAPADKPAVDDVNDMRNWRAVIERHESYDELILWFEHDLFDQLNLIQLLTWIRERLPPENVVSLVCIGSFPGHPRFKGLGELRPDELASLLGTRQPCQRGTVLVGGARLAGVPGADSSGSGRPAPARHVGPALPRGCRHPFPPGISLDLRWALSNRAPAPGSGRRRNRRSHGGLPAHARR